MRKIRGFKLNLRLKEIQRRIKKAKLDLSAQGIDSEATLASLLTQFSSHAGPSVLFESFPAETSLLSPIPGMAFTLALVTLGPGPGDFVEKSVLESPSPEQRRQLLDLIAQAAVDDATRFVLSLVEDEVHEENCELSPIQYLTEPSALESAVNRLEGAKIGVTANDTKLKPVYSSTFSVSWLARSKSRA